MGLRRRHARLYLRRCRGVRRQGLVGALRLATMPTVANGISFDWSLKRASGQNAEFEWRHGLLGGLLPPERKGTCACWDTSTTPTWASIAKQNIKFLAGPDANARHYRAPAAEHGEVWRRDQHGTGAHRQPAGFGRFGWNEGQHESLSTRRSIRRSNLVATTPASDGDGRTTRRALPLSPTPSSATTNST